MNNKKLVSIIIPMYNAERTLQRCLNSICNQEYSNIEIILVNDGSTDQTLFLCDKIQENDSRVIIVNKENGGVASARNAGIEKSTGQYILFVDCDDYIELDTISKIMPLSEENNLDMVIFGIQMDYVDEKYSVQKKYNEELCAFDAKSIQKVVFESCFNGLLYSPCNKLYCADIIKKEKIFFENNEEPIEDILFNCNYMQHINRVCVVEETFYHYVKEQKESEVTKYRKNLWKQAEKRSESLRELFSYWNMNEKECELWLCEEYIGGKADCISNWYRHGSKVTGKEKRGEIVQNILCNSQFKKAVKNVRGMTLYYDKKILILLSGVRLSVIIVMFYDILFFLRYRFRNIYYSIRKRMNGYEDKRHSSNL